MSSISIDFRVSLIAWFVGPIVLLTNGSCESWHMNLLFSLQIRTQRTLPLICGTVKRFLLFGDHDGDVFATGGEMEITQVRTVYQ